VLVGCKHIKTAYVAAHVTKHGAAYGKRAKHVGQIRTSLATLPLRKATMYSSVLSSLKNGESRTLSGRLLKSSAHLTSSTITATQAVSARFELIGIFCLAPESYEREISSCSSFWIAARMDWCIERNTPEFFWDEYMT
jgi:hypothetical protein